MEHRVFHSRGFVSFKMWYLSFISSSSPQTFSSKFVFIYLNIVWFYSLWLLILVSKVLHICFFCLLLFPVLICSVLFINLVIFGCLVAIVLWKILQEYSEILDKVTFFQRSFKIGFCQIPKDITLITLPYQGHLNPCSRLKVPGSTSMMETYTIIPQKCWFISS